MILTLDYELSTSTAEPMYLLRKDGATVAIKFDKQEAYDAFDKFVEAQKALKAFGKQTLKTVEL